MKDRLYVPVTLEALVVGKEPPDSRFVDLAYKFHMLSAEMPFGSEVVNDAFATAQERKGVHLHWTLPEALLKGEQREDGTLAFYELPDQWLIQRLHREKERTDIRAWLVESSLCSWKEARTANGMEKTTVPCFRQEPEGGGFVPGGPEGEMYLYLGGARPLSAQPPGDARYLEEFTAVSAGSVLFTAFYPYHRTVFGFYDNMEGAGEGDYTYIVCGHYREPSKDPLHVRGRKAMEEFGWVCQDCQPEKTLCHGTVRKVYWKGQEAEYGDSIPREEIKVAIGNTSAETLAAYYSHKSQNREAMERGLLAMQYRLLEETRDQRRGDRLLALEENLHAREFSSEAGGSCWRVKTQEGETDPFAIRLPEESYQALVALNEFQRNLDQKREQAVSLQKEILDAWFKYAQLQYDPWESDIPGAETFLQEAQDKTRQLERLEKELAESARGLEDRCGMLSEKLSGLGLALQCLPEEMYYLPDQPVIHLFGEGTGHVSKRRMEERDGTLVCRSRTADGLTVRLSGREEVLRAEALFPFCDPETFRFSQEAALLMAEELFTDTANAGLLAGLLKKKGAAEPLEAIERAVICAQEEAGKRILPWKPTDWRQPWNPLLMAWMFEIYPNRTSAGQEDSFEAYELGDIDLEPVGKAFAREAVTFSQTTLLTSHGAENFRQVLGETLERIGGGEGQGPYGRIREMLGEKEGSLPLSQQADGFHAALGMEQKVPMMPIVQIGEASRALSGKMGRLLKETDSLPVCDASFLPVRAGAMKLLRLRLIDSFGQYRDIPVEKQEILIAESMRMEEKSTALLRPRFLQAVRLEFRWLTHKGGEPALDRNSSPVFGFVLPDLLDRCLGIYTGEGVFQGTVQQGKEGCVWDGLDGQAKTPDDIAYGSLKLFVKSFLGKGNGKLQELLSALDLGFQSSAPDHTDPFVQLCFGNVLALASAGLALRGKGNPIFSQELDRKEDTYGYEKEKVTIRLGDGRKEQNGLMGFFLGGDSREDYECFHTCFGKGEGSGYLAGHDLTMSLSGDEVLLSVLFDPLGKITLRGGFLPAKDVTLPPVLYQEQMKKIQKRFRAAPVLAWPEDFQAPVPGKMEGQWAFTFWEEAGKRKTIEKIRAPEMRIDGRNKILEGFFVWKGGTSDAGI